MDMSCFQSSSTRILVVLFLFFVLNANNGQVLSIYVTIVEIDNDLPSSPVSVVGDIPVNQVVIKKGSPYSFLARGDEVQEAKVFLEQKKICSFLSMYDPKVDYNQRHIYWSIRESGVYRSVDQTNWKQTQPWITLCGF